MSDPEFSSLGGHPALDLVNTIPWRLSPSRRRDKLDGYTAVLAWCVQHAVISDAERAEFDSASSTDAQGADAAFRAVVRLRDALYDVVTQADTTAAALREIQKAYARAVEASDLAYGPEGARWQTTDLNLRTPLHRIAFLVVDVAAQHPLERFGQCNDDECGYVYIDTSPRHNRRWCSSADCGNRNRVRRHYQSAKAMAARS